METKTSQTMTTQRIHLTILLQTLHGHELASKIPTTDIDLMQFIQPRRLEFNFKIIAKTDLIQIIDKIMLNKAPGLNSITNKLN